MEKLKQMKECLVGIVEGQIYGNMDKVDAQELGAAVDMIKDLSEALYYCSITKAMEEEAHPIKNSSIEYYDPRYRESSMYAKDGNSYFSNGGSKGMYSRYDDGRTSYTMYNDRTLPSITRDPYEGKSGRRRKMYMENKYSKDKAHQLQELELYMQDLASDMTEMIQDASPEEKQLLQQKLSTLSAKIK